MIKTLLVCCIVIYVRFVARLVLTLLPRHFFTEKYGGILRYKYSWEKELRRWFALTCPVCGFRHPPKKFKPVMKSIHYPVQIVTGGGRARGFKVVKYLPWSTLPALKQTDVGKSRLCLYNRLGTAYDHFYEVLGFLSPKMRTLLQELQRTYGDSYRTNPFREYTRAYTSTKSMPDIVEPYGEDDYPEAYSHLLINPVPRGVYSG